MENTKNYFFTADTHFGSEGHLKVFRRPFDDVIQMDKTMIDNWNKVVKPNDTIYHIGDFGNFEITQYLNGNIVLIAGNHDNKEIAQNYFKHIYDDLLVMNKAFVNNKQVEVDDFYLNHYPSKMMGKKLNLFGHVHQLSIVKKFIRNEELYVGLNVGVDCHHFKPIDITEVMDWIYSIIFRYDNEVFFPLEDN